MIIISDYELAKEVLNHPMAMARPPHSFDFLVGKGGIIGMNGEEWQEQRRFVLQTMRDLGMGKGLWEKIIQVILQENFYIFYYQVTTAFKYCLITELHQSAEEIWRQKPLFLTRFDICFIDSRSSFLNYAKLM
ncbi:cytochrome P450 2J6 [Trichonephila clavata]|uniref:Cytochrome P450 2J6 n=1 Tax=Trichonephila clavata TaxID=2740835 RepID=A0A8X6HZB1_TRICU|nr:cytochrome P450 2J6 [Trichonephila clavata]